MKYLLIGQEELDDILRYGAKELFTEKDEDGKARQIHYDDIAIDRFVLFKHCYKYSTNLIMPTLRIMGWCHFKINSSQCFIGKLAIA